MGGIIIAFSKRNNAERISDIVKSHGFDVRRICSSFSAALLQAGSMSDGIVICDVALNDGHCTDFINALPPKFQVILITRRDQIDECPQQVTVIPSPFAASSLISALEDATASIRRCYGFRAKTAATRLSDEDKRCISEAKGLLIQKLHMTEQEAHRYIQKLSMDKKRSKIQTSRLIIRSLKDK